MPPATEIDDELLASLEPGSFAVFYRRHVEDLVAFFMRRTRNAELAADLAAETFLAAVAHRRGCSGSRCTSSRASSGARRPSGVHAGGWAWSGSSSRTLTLSASMRWGRATAHTCCWSESARSSVTRSARM